jgi:RNA polymerase sigma-70 factor (ECF subfamily)
VNESTSTRASLLLRIRDAQDSCAWNEFAQLYAPIIYAFGRRRGLQDADAADVTQEVLRAVSRSAGRFEYQADRGGFRHWLFTVTRNEVNDFLARGRRVPTAVGDTVVKELAQQSQPVEEGTCWAEECQKHLLDWAAEQVRRDVRESTWQAFWQTAVEGKSVEEVARALGISVGAVYIAKSRVVARLREQIEEHGNP